MIYAVVPLGGNENLPDKLAQTRAHVYSWHQEAGQLPITHIYFVSYKGTARELADKLGFEDKEGIEGVVVPVSNYAGYADKDLWEWLREQKGND